MTRRAGAVAAGALVLLAALAGCAAQPQPLSRDEKVARLQADVDAQWEQAKVAHPDLGLGDPPPVTVVTDGAQLRERQDCFTGLGIEVTPHLDGSYEFGEPRPGGTPMEVANIACWSAVVPESQLDWIWSDAQLQALWLHQQLAGECLERYGVEVPDAVPFARQLEQPEGVYFLYSAGWDQLRQSEWSAMERMCPSMPRWLPTG